MADQPHLGNKAPRPNRPRLHWCPACGPAEVKLCALHVFASCVAVIDTRRQLGIAAFLAECRAAGLSTRKAYGEFLHGRDKGGTNIDWKAYIERGWALINLEEAWLGVWDV
jgi:hypothetical protein